MLSIEESSPLSFLLNNAVTTSLMDRYTSLTEKRDALGLSNPGTIDGITKEVTREVFTTNHMFQGLRAEITKPFGISPLFHISHGFAIGSNLPSYNFSALYGTSDVFCQATIDNDFTTRAQFNYRWMKQFITKTQIQIAPMGAMIEVDNVYTGKDFSASVKAVNPTMIDGGLTGILVGQYLQSVTPNLALGLEALWQRQALTLGPESAFSYFGKYKGDDWIATAQLQAQGEIGASYWRKLTDKVQAGVSFTLQFAGLGQGALLGPQVRKEAVTTAGLKYDFRTSTFRAQVDSTGKLSTLLEKRVAVLMLTWAAEVDHTKNSAKMGISVALEQQPAEMEEMAAQGIQPEMPSIPF